MSSAERFTPGKLWSLWEMLTLDAKEFIVVLHTLISLEFKTRNIVGQIPPEVVAEGDATTNEMIKTMEALALPQSVTTARNMLIGADTAEKWHRGVDHVANAFMLELEGRKFYGPLRSFEKFFEQPTLFGDAVFTNFSSANEDITEAGTCLALERSTACVMHLMRALEAPLDALLDALGTTAKSDWGSKIGATNNALRARAAQTGPKNPDDQFYAELAAQFEFLKRAWRNPSMHLDRSYSPDRANEILSAVKTFMELAATKLKEKI